MAKIIGNTTATPYPRPDWNQTDEARADYIKNKPEAATVIDENSTDEQYPTAKAVYDNLKQVSHITKTLTKDDFVNGVYSSYIEDDKGIKDSDTWIIIPSSIKVRKGDKISIKANGLYVWWRLFDSQDLNTASVIFGGRATSIEDAYVFEEEGYVSIQIRKTDSSLPIVPEDYNCSITVTLSSLGVIDDELVQLKKDKQNVLVSGENIKTINGQSILGEGDIVIAGDGSGSGGANIDILTTVVPTDEHTNEQVYGAKALDEVFLSLEETINGDIKNGLIKETVKPNIWELESGIYLVRGGFYFGTPMGAMHSNHIDVMECFMFISDNERQSGRKDYYAIVGNDICFGYSVLDGINAETGEEIASGKYNWCRRTELINEHSSDIQYPTAKAVYDFVNNVIEGLENNQGIDISGATVGQTIKISAVDDDGKPTAWEPVDFPVGGGEIPEFKTINGESILGEGNITIEGGAEIPELKTINGVSLLGEGNIVIEGVETDGVSSDVAELREEVKASVGEITYNKDITSSLAMIDGQYYSKDNGNLTTYAGAKCTELFAVNEGERYFVSGSYGYHCGLIAEFDENKMFIQGVGTSEGNVNTPAEGYEYIVPAGVSYIGCSTRRTADYDANYRNVVVLKEVTEFNNIPKLLDDLEAKHNEDILKTEQKIDDDILALDEKITLTVENICPNSDFADDSVWELGNTATSMVVENNVATLTNDGSGTQTRIRMPLSGVPQDHIVYIQASIKSSPNAIWESFNFYTDASYNFIHEKPRFKNSIGLFNDYYGTFDFSQTSTSSVKLWITSTYNTVANAKDQVTQIKNVFICDLTESFGAGKEPTASEFYNILKAGGSWFKGSKQIFMVDLIKPTLPIVSNYLITVGENGDCQTINEAIEKASSVYPVYKKRGIKIEIRILDGTVIDEQILVEGIDLSYISITTDNADNKVIVTPTATNWDKNSVSHDSRGNMPFFAGEFGARLPMIKCLFSCTSPTLQIEDKTIGIVGYYCNRGSTGVVVAGAAYPENTTESGAGTKEADVGFEGFYDCIIANNNSEITIREAIARNAGRYGAMSRHISRVSARSADLTGCQLAAAYADRSSMIDVRFADVSDSLNGIQSYNTSNITAVETIANNIAELVAEAREGSIVNCDSMTIDSVKDVFKVLKGGSIVATGAKLSNVTGTTYNVSTDIHTSNGTIYSQYNVTDNTTYVKTVNGITPDENGNVELGIDEEVLNAKQDTLTSGVNIKTINGEDILGEGNIEITASNPEFEEEITNVIGTQAKDEVLVYDIGSEEGIYEHQVVTGNYQVATGSFNSGRTAARCTEKIAVHESEIYTIEGTCSGSYALISEFDENQNWIASYGATQLGAYSFSSVSPYNPYKYTVPEGVAYVAFATDSAALVTLKVIGPVAGLRKVDDAIANEVNPLKTAISNMNEDINETRQSVTDGFSKTSNEIGQTTYLEDITNTLILEPGRISKTGSVNIETDPAKEENGVHTLPFQVSAGEVYHVWGKYSTAQCIVAWYDEDKSFIDSVYVTESGVTTKVADNEAFTVPATLTDKSGVEKKVAYMACSTILNGDNPLAVKKEVARYNNVNNNIKGAVEDLSVTKLDKVLISPNGSEWVLTISDDGTLKVVKLRAFGEDVVTTLTLPNNLTAGIYTLKYENSDGALNDYADICSLEVATEGEIVSYNGLIAENCAPKTATGIGVYDSSNSRIDGLDLGFLDNQYSDKIYTFAAISDIHIGVSDGEEDFTNAVEYLENEDEVEFVTICGDMVNDSSKVTELETYQRIARGATKPIYVVTGNHEANNYNDGEDFDDIKGYFAQDNYPNINQELYYSFTYNNDVFIMVGTYGEPGYNKTFSLEELQWLYQTLEKNRNKRCFLYTHYYPIDGSGDPLGLYGGNGFGNSKGRAFLSLMQHYKNVIYFHGHTHTGLKVQEYHPMNNIDRIYGRYSINIPSLTWPRVPNADSTDYDKLTQAGEGYIVDVYENGIALRGRDFENGVFSPIGTYYLDTVIQKVEANSYKDPTGLLTTPVAPIE